MYRMKGIFCCHSTGPLYQHLPTNYKIDNDVKCFKIWSHIYLKMCGNKKSYNMFADNQRYNNRICLPLPIKIDSM